MSKYDELCGAFTASRQRWQAYERRCRDFAGWLYDCLIKYFEIPARSVRLVPAEGDADPTRTYTLPGAAKLMDDSYFHLDLVLTVSEGPDAVVSKANLRVRILIKQTDGDVFIVKLRNNDREFLVEHGKMGPLMEFLDHVHGNLVGHYEGELERFLAQSEHR